MIVHDTVFWVLFPFLSLATNQYNQLWQILYIFTNFTFFAQFSFPDQSLLSIDTWIWIYLPKNFFIIFNFQFCFCDKNIRHGILFSSHQWLSDINEQSLHSFIFLQKIFYRILAAYCRISDKGLLFYRIQ